MALLLTFSLNTFGYGIFGLIVMLSEMAHLGSGCDSRVVVDQADDLCHPSVASRVA